jgi:hypothetical protein
MRRELSFADLLPWSLAAEAAPAASAASPLTVAAQMALTPRKRSRKSLAPARAATGSEGSAPLPCGSDSAEQRSWRGEAEDASGGDSDAHSTPRKAARWGTRCEQPVRQCL